MITVLLHCPQEAIDIFFVEIVAKLTDVQKSADLIMVAYED